MPLLKIKNFRFSLHNAMIFLYILSSLIQTLVNQKSSLTATIESGTNESSDTTTTAIVDVTAWNTENDVHFMVHDLGGHDAYSGVHPMFTTETKAFYMLVYDHYRYTIENHYHHIGRWLDLLQMYAPGAIVKPVGTHIDRCRRGQAAEHLRLVRERIKQYEEERIFRINQQIEALDKVIDEQGHVSTLFELQIDSNDILSAESLEKNYSEVSRDQLVEQRENLLKAKDSTTMLRIQEINLVGSAEDMRGILQLTNDIEVMAVDMNLFPHAQRYILPAWQQIRKAIRLQPGQYSTRKDIVALVRDQRTKAKEAGTPEEDEQTAEDIIEFMCLTGEVLCLEHIPELQCAIFHRPQVLYDLLRGLFRHNIEAVLNFTTNRVFKSRSQFTAESFQEAKSRMTENGQISRPLLVCLWFYLKFTYEEFNAALELIPKLDMCYLIPQPAVPGPRSEYVPMMVLPSCVQELRPDDISDLWPVEVPVNMKQLEIIIKFPTYNPLDLYEQMSCRFQEHLDLRIDWKDTVFGQIDDLFLLFQKKTAVSNDPADDMVLIPRSPSPLTRCSSATSKDGGDGILTVTTDTDLSRPHTPVAPMTTENIQKLDEENLRDASAHYREQSTDRTETSRPQTTESDHKSVTESETERRGSRSRRTSIDTTVSERSESRRRARKRLNDKRYSAAGSSATWTSSKQPLRPGRPGPAMMMLKVRGANIQTLQSTLTYYHDHMKTLLAYRPGLPYYISYNAINCSDMSKEECFPNGILQELSLS